MASRAGYQIETWRRDQGREKLSAMLNAGKRGEAIRSTTKQGLA
jgi:hypothetical protein